MNSSETVPIALSPFCGELRSKKYYFLDRMPTEESDLLDGSGHCWCSHTKQAIGPDGELVAPSECTSERGCYRSRFEES
jgi:hypothetical protein